MSFKNSAQLFQNKLFTAAKTLDVNFEYIRQKSNLDI